MTRALLLVLALTGACARGSEGDDDDHADARGPADARPMIDAGPVPDARVVDAAQPPDAFQFPDAFEFPDAPLPDAFVVPDASLPDAFQIPDAATGDAPEGTTCLSILTGDPSSTNGPYTIDPGTGPIQVFCDMTHGGITYEKLGQGNHLTTYAGYFQVAIADLQDPVISQAFIWLYNHQSSSIINLDTTFTTGNCCIMAADSGSSMLALGVDNYVYPATTAGVSDCNSQYLSPAYRFWIVIPNVFSPAPMPTNFFASYPPQAVANCSVSNNPAWFFKKYQ